MTDSILGGLSTVRWALPIRTPQDNATEARHEGEANTEARHEGEANNAGFGLLRDTPLERVRGQDQATGETGHDGNGAGAVVDEASIGVVGSDRSAIVQAEQSGRAMAFGGHQG